MDVELQYTFLFESGTINGGVLLRVTGPDKVWPKSIEAQGQFNSIGDIWNIDAQTAPHRRKARRPMERLRDLP
jgi:hypothetical protein